MMNLSYRIGWIGFRLLFRCYFRYRIYNAERVPAEGAVLLASNHSSFLDPPLIGSCTPRAIHYLARDTLFRIPGFAQVLRSWNTVPVDREGGGPAGLKTMLDLLQNGAAVIVFPEGTRSRNGNLQPARSGIGFLTVKSNAPVLPIRVFGTYEAFGRHLRFPRPRPVAVKFGMPLNLNSLRDEAARCPKSRLKEIYQEIAVEVMKGIAALEPRSDAHNLSSGNDPQSVP
ncbi:MAG TPA: lysophospholipid acyltransferase family protein [Candidatus Paceibacterota bacterium]|nr:lysophospholipid acyltransferase family protein [Verrucomicrobiota bacterium]HRY47580.1 lysophospholipid acyltransferase family protein [Candidatus Paceibacterota bacterium]HRZ99217.1 lysophospholipid acyltransferase family protein [Candidatus Paceibacterota bacterium]